VEIDLDPDSAVISIDVKTHGEGYRGEGDFEGIPAQGYEDWKQGAVLGVAFALWTAGQSGCAVVITKIVGTNADTTPTTIAIAAMDAVWKALSYTPESNLTEKIGECLEASRTLPDTAACIPW
jgi:hypothetical protein